MVGEPRKRSRCAACWSGTFTSRSSGSIPSSRLIRSTSAIAGVWFGQPSKYKISTSGPSAASAGVADLSTWSSGVGAQQSLLLMARPQNRGLPVASVAARAQDEHGDGDDQDERGERDPADPGGERDADPGGGDQRQADATDNRNQREQAEAEVR